MHNNAKELALQIAKILDAKKAMDVVVLEISHLTIIADYFVIASGNTEIQVRALCDEMMKALREQGIEARGQEGYRHGRWVAVDYGDVVVHIFHREDRAFYNLERLWADSLPLSVDSRH
ncbi:ribosome-associated protein [Caldicoprobacter guelmensis]|uniref:ribosome silencing factor n=1 Tax=Caldicoprobacter guelmensis TaxID=1170224 RepID=UPI0024356066|nr:ribosome silencing factor [Caldicoprobacter guelmensis]MBM7582659.1 ribosome-associated protein [Caldicoprobacter guelmensis]